MSNKSEDIQAAGSDTRPPMLDRTDFESWQQRIWLYYKKKILLWESTYFSLLMKAHSGWDGAEMRLLQGLPRDIYKLINHNMDIWDNVKMLLEGSELTKDDRESQLYDEFEHFGQHKGKSIHDYYGRDRTGFKGNNDRVLLGQQENLIQPKQPQNSNYFKKKMLLMQAQENEKDLDKEQLLFLAVDQCDAFDFDIDEAPTTQTMFMANLSSADPVYDEAGPSYDSDTISEVQDHDNYLDNMNESHEEHEIHNDVQPNDVVDSDTEYTRNSNIISYEQYVQDNEDQGVHSDVSFIPNDAVMIITNDIYEQDAQCDTSNDTINASLTAKLARYKELAESFYNEVNRVAIGYKNPFYLSKAKEVQPALHNGYEIVKTNHARALVHDSEDTLEIAEPTRKQMIEKMKDPECVKEKVKIAPHDYSKENYLAKALKEKAKSTKPIIAMTVYPPNTPAKLDLIKPVKRGSHLGLTEWEKGFEQTKTCYLTEVIPFFKTIKEHFEGIQIALVNEIKEMKEVFNQMEAEVDQHAVDKKCDEIKRKNILIENENLIAECLSKDVFYTATNYVLTLSRFSDMHDAYIVAQKQLKAKISFLQKKLSEADPILDFKALDSQNKDLNAKVNVLQDLNKRFRVENKKVKQHYKELYDSIKLTRAKTIEKTTSLLNEIETLKAQIKGKTNCVTMHDPVKPKVFAPGTLYEIVKEARVEKPLDSSLASACLYTKHSQELLEYVIGTCPKDFNKRDRKITTAPLNRKKRVTFVEPGVKDATADSGSKPRSNTKKDRTLPAKSGTKKVEDHSRNNKSSVKQNNCVDSSISYKRTIINSNSNYVCKTCNKCLMSFNHDKCVVNSLKFVKKPPVKKVWRVKQVKQVWQATGNLFTNVGFQWLPTKRKFTLGEQCPLTRFTKSKVVPVK
ncbi:hypothetical protein Tco_0264407 [Tanacetum coccineum]